MTKKEKEQFIKDIEERADNIKYAAINSFEHDVDHPLGDGTEGKLPYEYIRMEADYFYYEEYYLMNPDKKNKSIFNYVTNEK